MAIKTYGARGLIEWQMALNACGAIIRLKFTGGYMGSNGVVAAKYSTDNEALQNLIEKSPEFNRGKVYLCPKSSNL